MISEIDIFYININNSHFKIIQIELLIQKIASCELMKAKIA